MSNKAVILAGGLGTRMSDQSDQSVKLTGPQAIAADTGVKGMIPIKRPFMDYVISALADAGYRKICLVIGTGNEYNLIREHYESMERRRVAIEFAIQKKPLGTANAVLAAEKFAGNDSFLVINSDNYYPVEALTMLHGIDTQGLIAFEREGLLSIGSIPKQRIANYAIVRADRNGFLSNLIEKPGPEMIDNISGPVYLSINCWLFFPSIFKACMSISISRRGEYEITDAVQYSIHSLGEKFRIFNVSLPVLDLSIRSDIPVIASRLSCVEVSL